MRFGLKLAVSIILVYHLFIYFISQSISYPRNETKTIPKEITIKDLEDTLNSLELKYTPPESKCKPHQNSYTDEEIKKIFKYKNYGPCKTPSNDTISYIDQNLTIKCQQTQNPEYGVGDKNENFGGMEQYKPIWSYNLPDIENRQFLFIKCSDESIHALVFNRYKPEVSIRADNIRKKIGGDEKQMSVLLLVFDSISRYSFQRNLPLTANFLKGFKQDKEFKDTFKIFEFTKNANIEARTRLNISPILYGKSWDQISKVLGDNMKLLDKKDLNYQDYQKKNAIWSLYSTLGYVTMFSYGTVRNDINAITGKTILTDHVFTNFWKYLWGVFGWHDIEECQKCVGNRNSHDFSLDYTYQFFENYPNNHKFAYVHSNAAHEETGNVKTIDEDLLRFLKQFLTMIKHKNENLALFLISDHGYKQIKGAQWDIRSFFEYITPFTFLIATNEVLINLTATKILSIMKLSF